MSTDLWQSAVLSPREGRQARVRWDGDRHLPPELIPLAGKLGYSGAELAAYCLGELAEDLTVEEETYLRGALVLPDADGLPAALFGRPLQKS